MSNSQQDEETPLLSERYGDVAEPQKELSWFQIIVVLLLHLAEHISTQVLNPFLPELVRDLEVTNGDESKVSFYVGLVQSLYFGSQTLTTLFWSRASDRLGRKPIVLCGMFAAAFSMFGVGLSRVYIWLVISRCINGVFNGNVGVIKSLMGEVTSNSEKLAKIYSILPIAWSITGTIGPLVGGYLSSPTERFPDIFGSSRLLKSYPYFLPCTVTASFILLVWLFTAVFLKETLAYRESFASWLGFSPGVQSTKLPGLGQTPPSHSHGRTIRPGHGQGTVQGLESERPLPMGTLLRNPRVLLAAANYACLCLTQASLSNFLPVQLSTPVDKGGMGFDPPLIGRILSTYGFMNGVLQLLLFARIHKYLGVKRFFMLGLSCAIPMTLSLPLSNYLLRTYGLGIGVWIVIAVQTLAKIGLSMSYGALFILIVAAAPNNASLGATNGLCQTIGNFMRAAGPAITSTLFSVSLQKGLLGGNLVYVFFLCITVLCLITASSLPRELWNKKEETSRH